LKKIVALLFAFAVVLTIVGCEPAEPTLVIFQNKVEIDDVLRDYAEAWGEANNVKVEVKTCGGDTCQYGTQILAEFQANKQPDIFVIEGLGGYNVYDEKILPLDGEEWIQDTDVAFVVDGTVYGFPVAIEAWGMAYNEDLLKAAGMTDQDIEDLKVVSQAEYRAVFEMLEAYFVAEELDYAVVSMAAGAGMHWVTGLHNFNGYLSAGLAYDDSSIINMLLDGQVDEARLGQLVDWVELLFEFADQEVLKTGGYDEQVNKFANGEAAFLHQGNWTDSSYANSTFAMGYLPHATLTEGNDSIFIGAPSYYVINKDSEMIDEAKMFLNDMASTAEGHDYMVNQANMVPAFNSVTLIPSTPLSAAALEWSQAGKAYAWWQNDMPSDFGMGVLGPIYELFAKGNSTREQFLAELKAAIEGLA
jgi:raffinose/stachyose/melibiose transport system substrate-binding protein